MTLPGSNVEGIIAISGREGSGVKVHELQHLSDDGGMAVLGGSVERGFPLVVGLGQERMVGRVKEEISEPGQIPGAGGQVDGGVAPFTGGIAALPGNEAELLFHHNAEALLLLHHGCPASAEALLLLHHPTAKAHLFLHFSPQTLLLFHGIGIGIGVGYSALLSLH